MSTRSGKRIHSSIDNTITENSEAVTKPEKKTRNKRFKENNEHQEDDAKKQKHYVLYPTDDEGGYVTATDVVDAPKSTRKAKKNTLKEHNINVLDNEDINIQNDRKTARVTRQTRKFAENIDEGQNIEVKAAEETLPNEKVKAKRNKKRRSQNPDENVEEPVQDVEVEKVSKNTKKKKKGKGKKTSTENVKQTTNKSNISTDSFHSAAGSPLTMENMDVDEDMVDDEINKTLVKENKTEVSDSSKKGTRKKKNTSLKPTPAETEIDESETLNGSGKDFKPANKSSLNVRPDENDTLTITDEEVIKITDKNKGKKRKDTKSNEQKEAVATTSVDLNSTYDKIDIEAEKSPKARRSLHLYDSATEGTVNATKDVSDILNTMFEKDTKLRSSVRSNNSTTENGKDNALNTTYEKSRESLGKALSLDSTFDKSATKLNTTFDKIEAKTNSGKSSLVTSDEGTINITFDKDNSRISITSDDSNIVNTTPVLIESSLDESRLSVTKSSKSVESPKDEAAKITQATPLKREGTFTKESPESVDKTPTKRQTLPSPGFTPFHGTRSSNKEKSVLNATRSLEKPARRSLLADMAPTRQTRVMFCSPMNNPAVVLQQKKKVIKSSMKGSNKSFVYEDTTSSVPRPSAHKRSLTQDDAGDARAKRKRLADDLQMSVDRLSRPRTSSASAKLSETTPSKKLPTPSKPKTDPKRTRLPNFAALHQKQFDKMESLSDCQQRKMRRAKKLLVPKTPNGTVMVLERSSPRGTQSPKTKEIVAKKSETPLANPEGPSKMTKIPTLESLRPGFTRFGFKMNTDFNPFSIPSKSDAPKKTEKQNGVIAKPVSAPKTPASAAVKLTKLPTLPSLYGVTTSRKEAAKQAIMREKSFTSLGKRDTKRNESRTIIKGVRTNRRFDLQMKMRNLD